MEELKKEKESDGKQRINHVSSCLLTLGYLFYFIYCISVGMSDLLNDINMALLVKGFIPSFHNRSPHIKHIMCEVLHITHYTSVHSH